MTERDRVFVDSGAWIALAIESDGLHSRALDAWERIESGSALRFTSVPVVMETFTFLERNTRRDVARAWRESLRGVRSLKILECGLSDLETSWSWFDRKDLPKLSAVDATSFVLMRRHRIRHAFTFDVHFAIAGFLPVG